MKPPDYQQRFELVENWHVRTVSGDDQVHVGSPERLLIVCEAPSHSYPQTLGGASGRRLAKLLGMSNREVLLDHVDVFNLLSRPLRRTRNYATVFPMREAAWEACGIRFEAAGVILVGRTMRAWGLQTPLKESRIYGVRVLPLPSLSGLNRAWWNSKENAVAARNAIEPFATFACSGRWPR